MKRFIYLIFLMIVSFSSCKKNEKEDSPVYIREIAWNWLDNNAKSTVIVDWRQAPVQTTVYSQKQVYAVIFNTDMDALLGPITVYVDTATKKVLGQALRD
jgi:hypothetical protein